MTETQGRAWVITRDDGDGCTHAATLLGDLEAHVYSCVHLYQHCNSNFAGMPESERTANETDYLHICDLEEFIADLIELLKLVGSVKSGRGAEFLCQHEYRERVYRDGRLIDNRCQACGHITNNDD